MAEYVWDLGFDFDHRAKSDGTYDLQIGLVGPKNGTYVPASPVYLKAGDLVGFSIYDLTSSDWASTAVNAVVIEFSEAKIGDRKTIFKMDEVILAPKFEKNSTNATSAYFGGGARPFYRHDGRWTIHTDAKGQHCEMTVTMWVTKTKTQGVKTIVETRKFIVDPEMIIDSQ